MTPEQFAKPMEQLRSVFGERHYTEGRVSAFWQELQGTPHDLWLACVRRLILDEVHPPMMKQIRMAIAQERERRYEIEKSQTANQSERFFQEVSTICPPDIREKFAHLFKSPKGGEE